MGLLMSESLEALGAGRQLRAVNLGPVHRLLEVRGQSQTILPFPFIRVGSHSIPVPDSKSIPLSPFPLRTHHPRHPDNSSSYVDLDDSKGLKVATLRIASMCNPSKTS